MRRIGLALLFLVGFALAGGAAAAVGEGSPTTTVTTTTAPTTTTTSTTVPTTTVTTTVPTTTVPTTTVPTTTAPTTTSAPPPPRVLPRGVRVAGVAVGGMTSAAAYAAVQTALARPLPLVLDRARFAPTRARLGAVDYLHGAIAKARAAAPGTRIGVVTTVHGSAVRAYVAKLSQRYDREPVDATLRLRDLQPALTRDRPGRRLDAALASQKIVRALRTKASKPLTLPTSVLEPTVTRASFGAVIVIRRASNRLSLYRGTRPWRQFTVATGQAIYPTPLGSYHIVAMWKNPWWYPPASPWAKGAKPVPPGPGNPLGTRWMGISAPGVGIHGTPDAASLGYSASHGCIRMAIPEAEWLFDHVTVGTPVYVVPA